LRDGFSFVTAVGVLTGLGDDEISDGSIGMRLWVWVQDYFLTKSNKSLPNLLYLFWYLYSIHFWKFEKLGFASNSSEFFQKFHRQIFKINIIEEETERRNIVSETGTSIFCS
jgi:hypothetical protein